MKINCDVTNRVVEHLLKNNVECYIVGGYVRDNLLGLNPKDIDIELHNTDVDTAFRLITQITPAKVYGTFGIIALNEVETEFALARTETKTGTLHHQFDIKFIRDGDLKLAASRRDFTINSIMYDLRANKLIDNFGGVDDLNNQVIRHVSDAFSEDPLRILRGVKFASRFGFKLDTETKQLCLDLSNQLSYLPTQRISNELEQIFKGPHFTLASCYLTSFINQIFQQQLKPVTFTTNPLLNKVNFFWQFSSFEKIIDFCYEQKQVKKDLKFILNNYDNIIDFNSKEVGVKFNLLENMKYREEYIEVLNNQVLSIYEIYLKLKEKYNGRYFINKGIVGKQIKIQQEQVLKEKLNELSNSHTKK